MEYLVLAFFLIALAINARAVFKLAPGLEGHAHHGALRARVLCPPLRAAHRRDAGTGATRAGLPPSRARLSGARHREHGDRALVSSRYPHGRLHVVVITKEEEERAPHPLMGASTGELVRRLRETLPPYQQKRLIHVAMPGPGRKAQQLNWALRARRLTRCSATTYDPRRRLRGGERRRLRAGSRHLPLDRLTRRAGTGALAYQGIPLSLANHDAGSTSAGASAPSSNPPSSSASPSPGSSTR